MLTPYTSRHGKLMNEIEKVLADRPFNKERENEKDSERKRERERRGEGERREV